MGIQGLDFQPRYIPLSRGLNTKGDARAKEPPLLDICRDVQFDDVGGVQTRHPFVALGGNVQGGGTIANARRLYAVGSELVLFTNDTLYSWDARDSVWVARATHLAVKVAETEVFSTNADQTDCQRAELGNTVIYSWTNGFKTQVAALDKTTGAVIVAPTTLPFESTGVTTNAQLVSLVTKILLFYRDGINIRVRAIDPATVATGLTGGGTIVGTADGNFDVMKIPGVDAAFLAATTSGGTSYQVAKITAALAISTATPNRTADGPISCSVDPTGAKAQIVRSNGTNIQGDLIDASTLADVYTAQAIGTTTGTPVNAIASAHRSVQNGGAYRCYAFWCSEAAVGAGVPFKSKSNWVDTANAKGTQTDFVRLWQPVSRAFDCNGSVFCWGAFAGQTTASAAGFSSQLQNSNFLFRDDATLIAKCAFDRADGIGRTTLAGVQLVSGTTGFACAAAHRRIIPIGDPFTVSLGYSARIAAEVLFTFDSNDARRLVQIGPTAYITGGELLQYDGVGLFEVGFSVYPWAIGATQSATGSIADGTYAWKATWKWTNARGDTERSTTATVGSISPSGGPQGVDVTVNPVFTTRKTTNPIIAEIWRTKTAPVASSPFFLITSQDPNITSNPNRFLQNDTTVGSLPVVHDALADASLATLPSIAPGDLENVCPPGATIIAATAERLFLAGITGDPDRIWYSKRRAPGEVIAFNDALKTIVPRAGGAMTALLYAFETLFAFRATAIYAFGGDGFDNAGGGGNYGPARVLSLDLGAVNQESVALTPKGIVFKSSKGWYLLQPSFALQYIGAQVSSFDSDSINAITVLEAQHHIRIVTSSRVLVFDYYAEEWAEWTIADGVHAAVWNGTYVYLAAGGPKPEQAALTGLTYGFDLETAWIKVSDQQGRGVVRFLQVLGEFVSACHIRVRIARDYQSDGAGGWLYFDDKKWAATPTTVGGPIQMRHGPSQKRCEAIKVRLTALATDDINPPSGAGLKLTGIVLDVGVEPGIYQRLSAAQKQ